MFSLFNNISVCMYKANKGVVVVMRGLGLFLG